VKENQMAKKGKRSAAPIDQDTENKKFKSLPDDWKSSRLSTKDPDELKAEITRCAMNHIALDLAQKVDPDLLSLASQIATAREVYKEGKKTALLKIEFLMEALKGMGVVGIPSIDDFLSAAAKRAMAPQDEDEAQDDGLAKAEADAAESHTRVNKVVADAVKGLQGSLSKNTTLTINAGGKTATLQGTGPASE
jgi:hypothetical protein